MATATSTRRRGLTGGVADKTPCIAASTANLTLLEEANMSLTKREIEDNLAFLERCPINGKEAETMVRLRYKLIAMREGLLKALAPPSKKSSRSGNRKPGK